MTEGFYLFLKAVCLHFKARLSKKLCFFPPRLVPIVGQGVLIAEASRSLRHTTLDKIPLDECSARRETSTWHHTTLTRDRHLCPRRNSNLQSQQASDRRLTT